MNSAQASATVPAGVRQARSADCCFPECEAPVVTSTGMCDEHRLVAVSSTGSWLEAR